MVLFVMLTLLYEEESFKELWKDPGSKIFNFTWPFYTIIAILGYKWKEK